MGRRIYSVPMASGTIGTAVQDIFCVKAGALSGIQIHHVQLSAAGVVTAAEVAMRLKRATATLTLASVGGVAVTPVITDQGDTLTAAVSTAFVNGTTQGTTSGAFTNLAYFNWNVLLPFDYMPGPEDEDREACAAGGAGFVLDLPGVIGAAYAGTTGFFKYREVP